MSKMVFLDRLLSHRGANPVTTFRRGMVMERPMLKVANRNLETETALRKLAGQAAEQLRMTVPAKFDRLIELQEKGITPDASLQDEIRVAALSQNRLPEGRIALLEQQDYLALTPHTPSPTGQPWDPSQVLINSPEELRALARVGTEELRGNSEIQGIATAATGMPAAGVASRALKFAQAHPELVAKIKALGGTEGLEEGDLPPRFLYPINTGRGIQTLLGLMLENSAHIGRELGAIIPSILMLNSESSGLVLDRLAKEKGHWSKDEKEAVVLFTQSLASRLYLSDQSLIEGQLFPTGHGDFSNLLAKYRLYEFMAKAGIKYLFFANGDEFLWAPDPTMVGIAKNLIEKGYAGMVFVVPNTNNQPGGGAVKALANPEEKFIVENPCMPKSLVSGGKYPLGLNTTFYALSTRWLADATEKLLTLSPALDIKDVKGRKGGIEMSLSLESWAGCEFTNPANDPKLAFVFAPRPGFFLGIKTLEQSHSDVIPPEIKGHPAHGSLSYEQYVKHMADTYASVMSKIISGDRAATDALFANGYSYLI